MWQSKRSTRKDDITLVVVDGREGRAEAITKEAARKRCRRPEPLLTKERSARAGWIASATRASSSFCNAQEALSKRPPLVYVPLNERVAGVDEKEAYYRKEAETCRSMAKLQFDPKVRLLLESVARQFERLAVRKRS